MAITIREFLGTCHVASVEDSIGHVGEVNLREANNSRSNVDSVDPESLMVEIEGLHAIPFATGNYTRYTPKALKESVPGWITPYRKPLLKHHDEDAGEPIGRVISAEYVTKDTRSGTPAIRFLVNIPDKKAIEDVKNGLLLTTSVGVTATDVRCSICGSHIMSAKDGCPEGHVKGVSYQTDNGIETCYWDVHEYRPKELSYVDVPSDMYAKNLDYYPATENRSRSETHLKESLDNNNSINEGENMMEKELKNAQDKIAELEAQVIQMTEAKKASDDKVTELTSSVEALNKQVSELTETNVSLKEAADELNKKIADLEENNVKLKESVAESDALKETMETEIAETKAQLKESLADTYVILKDAIDGKSVEMDVLKNRSMDSLRDSIVDMKESLASRKQEMEMKESQKKAEEDKADSLKDLKDSVQPPTGEVEMKESEHDKEVIDLKAGFQSIFSSIVSARC